MTTQTLIFFSTNFPLDNRLMGRVGLYTPGPPRWNPNWHGEGAYLTKSFQPLYQQEEFVGAMLSSRTNGSS